MLKKILFGIALSAVMYAGDDDEIRSFSQVCCCYGRYHMVEADPLLEQENPRTERGSSKKLFASGGQTCADFYQGRSFEDKPKLEDFKACTGLVLTYCAPGGQEARCVVPQDGVWVKSYVTSKREEPLWGTFCSMVCAGVFVYDDQKIRNAPFSNFATLKIIEFLQKNAAQNNWGGNDIPWENLKKGYTFCVVPENDEALHGQEVTITGVGTGWSTYGWRDSRAFYTNQLGKNTVLAEMLRGWGYGV